MGQPCPNEPTRDDTMPTPCPAVRLMRNFGLIPDPWQVEVLESNQRQLLLNCCRQVGKSTVVALLALARRQPPDSHCVSPAGLIIDDRCQHVRLNSSRIWTSYYWLGIETLSPEGEAEK
jgi:hypothetical protein